MTQPVDRLNSFRAPRYSLETSLRSPDNMRVPKISSVEAVWGLSESSSSTLFDSIVLVTPKSDWVVRCDVDTDEVIISRQKKRRRSGQLLARGNFQVAWTWLLTNHQGYTDGFRIDMIKKKQRTVFDFVAAASYIEVRKAETIEANQSLETTPLTRRVSA